MMVSNNTLSHISRKVGIFGAVKIHRPGSATEEDQTVAADAFEAYVGALYKEGKKKGDFSTLTNWFASIFNVGVFPELKRIGDDRSAALWGRAAKKARHRQEQLMARFGANYRSWPAQAEDKQEEADLSKEHGRSKSPDHEDSPPRKRARADSPSGGVE